MAKSNLKKAQAYLKRMEKLENETRNDLYFGKEQDWMTYEIFQWIWNQRSCALERCRNGEDLFAVCEELDQDSLQIAAERIVEAAQKGQPCPFQMEEIRRKIRKQQNFYDLPF